MGILSKTTTVNDADIISIILDLYTYPDRPPAKWDYLDEGLDDGVCWAVKRVDDFDIVVFRGSTTLEDWRRDFQAMANAFDTSVLGPVHPGFLRGMSHVWSDLKPLLRVDAKPVVCGHSLGAARASIMAALMIVDNRPPVARVVFGEPRPGFAKLASIVSKVPGRSYRNKGPYRRRDIVTDVPFNIGYQAYVHPTPLIDVYAPPLPSDKWGLFAWHHIELYSQAINSLPIIPTI